MNLLMIPRLALKALRQNMLRTGLTMLGIIIGVGAVICVVAIGEGAQASVERAITNIGANMIWVEAGGVNRGGVRTGAFGTKTLTLGDYEAIKEHIHLVTNVTPQADTRVQVVYGNQNWGTSVRGVGPEYLPLKTWSVPTTCASWGRRLSIRCSENRIQSAKPFARRVSPASWWASWRSKDNLQ